MKEWNYGDAYKRHPIETGTAIFSDGSMLKCHDIFKPLPSFMKGADLIFVDAPWNKGNLTSFYTKAEIKPSVQSYETFYKRLFKCIEQISPETAYCEIGKEYLTDFITQMKTLYPYVNLYNSTYYHRPENICYVVRGAKKRKKLPLDGMDEENIIQWICENENYHCIADLCMGRGLVAINAAKNGKKFLGTELNHKRLSVALETLSKMGLEYEVEGINRVYNSKQKQWTLNYLKKLKEVRFRVKPEEYEKFEKAAKTGEYASMRAFFIDAINEKIKNLEEIEKNKL